MKKMPAKFETVNVETDRLFFDEWEYCARFELKNAHLCRPKKGTNGKRWVADKETIDGRLKARIKWDKIWTSSYKQKPHLAADADITQLFLLHDFVTQIENQHSPIKVVYSGSIIYIYSNTPNLVTDNPPWSGDLKLTRSVISRPRDTILRKDNSFKFRTYFAFRFLTEEQASALRTILTSLEKSKSVKFSASLSNWVNDEHRVLFNNYFIDSVDEKWKIMVRLIGSKFLGKTLVIIPHTPA